jgi:hypothetical protein
MMAAFYSLEMVSYIRSNTDRVDEPEVSLRVGNKKIRDGLPRMM